MSKVNKNVEGVCFYVVPYIYFKRLYPHKSVIIIATVPDTSLNSWDLLCWIDKIKSSAPCLA